MKAIILLAGKGKRISDSIKEPHKSLIPISGHAALWYLINNILNAGIVNIIAVTGFHGDAVKEYLCKAFPDVSIQFAVNKRYETTNNLASVLCAKPFIEEDDFIVINGDMIFDYHILERIKEKQESSVAIDVLHRKDPIDSPGTIIVNDQIKDLGRHIPLKDNCGYAIGIYRFSADIITDYFDAAEQLILDSPNAGFHDPLRELFRDHDVYACDIGDCLWMDIDRPEDIDRAYEYISLLKDFNS